MSNAQNPLAGLPPELIDALIQGLSTNNQYLPNADEFAGGLPSYATANVKGKTNFNVKPDDVETAAKRSNYNQDQYTNIFDPRVGLLTSLLGGGPATDWNQFLGSSQPEQQAVFATPTIDSYLKSSDPVLKDAATQIVSGVDPVTVKRKVQKMLTDSGALESADMYLSGVDDMATEYGQKAIADSKSQQSAANSANDLSKQNPLIQMLAQAGLPSPTEQYDLNTLPGDISLTHRPQALDLSGYDQQIKALQGQKPQSMTENRFLAAYPANQQPVTESIGQAAPQGTFNDRKRWVKPQPAGMDQTWTQPAGVWASRTSQLSGKGPAPDQQMRGNQTAAALAQAFKERSIQEASNKNKERSYNAVIKQRLSQSGRTPLADALRARIAMLNQQGMTF